MASNSEKKDFRNAKRTASKMQKGTLRVSSKAVKSFNKASRAEVKMGRPGGALKLTSSSYKVTRTNSAKKPSMPVKTGVKNKLKTQGKAATHSGKGYMRTGKK
jgi:hypothetical protein